MKKIVFSLLLIVPLISYPQKKPVSYTINYDNISNGKKAWACIKKPSCADAVKYVWAIYEYKD